MTTKSFVVWGCGPAQAPMIREAETTERAQRIALRERALQRRNHYDVDILHPGDESWAVEVIAAESDLDAATRYDRAVLGYCAIPSRTAAKRQAHQESHMYRQGSGWIVSTWSDEHRCNVIDQEAPWPVARQALADWRRSRTAELLGEMGGA